MTDETRHLSGAWKALAEAVDAAFLGGVREDGGGPIPTYLVLERELADRGYVVAARASAPPLDVERLADAFTWFHVRADGWCTESHREWAQEWLDEQAATDSL